MKGGEVSKTISTYCILYGQTDILSLLPCQLRNLSLQDLNK